MTERLDRVIPTPAAPGVTFHKIGELVLRPGADEGSALVAVTLLGDNGEEESFRLASGAPARALLAQLNKADLSANSLQQRVLQKLVDDGHIDGAVSGTPD